MTQHENGIQHVSDTALWVAHYRALESKRPDALFHDPLAEVLIGERGKHIARSMRSFSKYTSWSLILRTKVIDDLIMKALDQQGCKAVINLGAGYDTRPYRLTLPKDLLWVEIDFPDVIQMKTEKLKNEKPACRLERIPLDLSGRAGRQKTFADLNQRIENALVLTEGVLPYLTEEMVRELATDLKSLSNVKLWIGEYYSPQLYKRFQSKSFAKRLRNAPFRFFPKDWFGFFAGLGWKKKEVRYLYDEGEKRNRKFPLPWLFAWMRPFVNPEKLAAKLRLQAYVVFEKS